MDEICGKAIDAIDSGFILYNIRGGRYPKHAPARVDASNERLAVSVAVHRVRDSPGCRRWSSTRGAGVGSSVGSAHGRPRWGWRSWGWPR